MPRSNKAPNFQPGNKNGRGRPLGSRNKKPQLLQDLIVLTMELSGRPRLEWVQELDTLGQPIFQTRKKVDGKGKPVKDKHGNVVWEYVRDGRGKPIPLREQKRIFEGDEGALGYLSYLAQDHPTAFVPLVRAVLPFNVRIPSDGDKTDAQPLTSEALLSELEGRGVPVDYFLSEMRAMRKRPNVREFNARRTNGQTSERRPSVLADEVEELEDGDRYK